MLLNLAILTLQINGQLDARIDKDLGVYFFLVGSNKEENFRKRNFKSNMI